MRHFFGIPGIRFRLHPVLNVSQPIRGRVWFGIDLPYMVTMPEATIPHSKPEVTVCCEGYAISSDCTAFVNAVPIGQTVRTYSEPRLSSAIGNRVEFPTINLQMHVGV